MKAIVLIGKPCSGKTTASKYIEKELDIKYYSTGDIVREMMEKENGSDYTGEELGEFSTEKRKEDVAYATKGAFRKAKKNNDEIVVFEGVRCKKEIDFLRQNTEELLTIYIHLPFEERARRLIERGREGENSKEVLKERDEREEKWGLEELIEDSYYDIKINGNCSKKQLNKKVKNTLEQKNMV